MTQFLPPNLLALFAARDPIPFKPPAALLSWEKDRIRNPYTGISSQTTLFEDPKDTPPRTRGETKQEKKSRRIKEKAILRAKEIEEEVKNYDPHNDKDIAGDAFKTLFVARINYDTSESKLRREFDMYGQIRKITMVKDSNDKPRGYAFIEFEHERDMHTAYKNGDGKKIDGRRVLVDVERGRTVKGWRPRRLGGGLGTTRRGANEENVRPTGRDTGRPEREDDRRDNTKSASLDRSRRPPSRERESRRDVKRDRDRGDVKRDRDRDGGDVKRDRDRDGDRDRKRDRDRDRKDRDKDEPNKDKGRDRDRDRKHRHRDKDRSRERDRDGSRRKRSKERDRKDRDRSDRDKDRRSRSDKDKSKEDPKREPSEGDKQEGSNGNMDHGPSYDGDHQDGERDRVKEEPGQQDDQGAQESFEKGQGDFQNPEATKGHSNNEEKYGESENMEY